MAGRKSISCLFESGRKIDAYPLRILYNFADEMEYPAKMAVSVPKRVFRRAVDRNKLKRRIREAYRNNKPDLYAKLKKANICLRMVIQHRGQQVSDYQTIEKSMQRAFKQLKVS